MCTNGAVVRKLDTLTASVHRHHLAGQTGQKRTCTSDIVHICMTETSGFVSNATLCQMCSAELRTHRLWVVTTFASPYQVSVPCVMVMRYTLLDSIRCVMYAEIDALIDEPVHAVLRS